MSYLVEVVLQAWAPSEVRAHMPDGNVTFTGSVPALEALVIGDELISTTLLGGQVAIQEYIHKEAVNA